MSSNWKDCISAADRAEIEDLYQDHMRHTEPYVYFRHQTRHWKKRFILSLAANVVLAILAICLLFKVF